MAFSDPGRYNVAFASWWSLPAKYCPRILTLNESNLELATGMKRNVTCLFHFCESQDSVASILMLDWSLTLTYLTCQMQKWSIPNYMKHYLYFFYSFRPGLSQSSPSQFCLTRKIIVAHMVSKPQDFCPPHRDTLKVTSSQNDVRIRCAGTAEAIVNFQHHSIAK